MKDFIFDWKFKYFHDYDHFFYEKMNEWEQNRKDFVFVFNSENILNLFINNFINAFNQNLNKKFLSTSYLKIIINESFKPENYIINFESIHKLPASLAINEQNPATL